MFDKSQHNVRIFCSVDKLAGLSFNGGLMFAGLVPIAYDWRDFINTVSMFRCGFANCTVTGEERKYFTRSHFES